MPVPKIPFAPQRDAFTIVELIGQVTLNTEHSFGAWNSPLAPRDHEDCVITHVRYVSGPAQPGTVTIGESFSLDLTSALRGFAPDNWIPLVNYYQFKMGEGEPLFKLTGTMWDQYPVVLDVRARIRRRAAPAPR